MASGVKGSARGEGPGLGSSRTISTPADAPRASQKTEKSRRKLAPPPRFSKRSWLGLGLGLGSGSGSGLGLGLGLGLGFRFCSCIIFCCGEVPQCMSASARMNCGGSLLPCRSTPPPAESEMGGGRPPGTPCICTPCAIEGELAPAPEDPQPEAHWTSLRLGLGLVSGPG